MPPPDPILPRKTLQAPFQKAFFKKATKLYSNDIQVNYEKYPSKKKPEQPPNKKWGPKVT